MAATKHKGLNDGVTGEWTLIAKIKPGQAEALREYIKTRQLQQSPTEKDMVVSVGTVHDYRWLLFDNDTRIEFTSNFDGDWGQYIDDFFATKRVEEAFDGILSFCEGYDKSVSASAKKDWLQARTQPAVHYTRAYRGTVKEMLQALELQKAFQQVLDDPAAVKALTQTPALKPLLDRAAK